MWVKQTGGPRQPGWWYTYPSEKGWWHSQYMEKMFQTTNQQQCLLISSFDHPNFGLFQFWSSPFFNIPISSVSPPLLTSLTYVHCRFLAETSPCLLQCYSCCYYCCSYSCDLTCKLSPSKKRANDILQRCSRTILNILNWMCVTRLLFNR